VYFVIWFNFVLKRDNLVVAVQALQEEIESLRRDINILKKVVAEKEQEILCNGSDQPFSLRLSNNINNNSNNNNNNRRIEEATVYAV